MGLSYKEIEKYLSYISSGIKYIYISDHFFIFKYPSNEIKQRADLIYDKAYREALEDGMLPLKDLEALIDQRNVITSEEVEKLKKLRGQLEAQEILLGKTTRVKANQERIKQVINRLKHEISQIEFKKKSNLLVSAENKAEEDKVFYVCSRCVYREDNSLVWPTYEDALSETRLGLKDTIVSEYLKFYSGIPVEVIREIARSSIWRIRYISSVKTSDPLFGVAASNYTTDQLSLSYWSNFYQSIFEMMPEDRPIDAVIEDDDALDAYMKNFYEERSREEASRRSKSKRSGKLSAFDSEEVIVTRSHELYEDIKYDTPREALKIKNRVDVRKRTKRG
ncbi:MAG: hypothetical protein DRO67_03535 [Candidatus Asgardarchaeum californiense]|nr:MAG: hypothetical protein DRO67_03535 [Candidatus Asgardarchaeum californiense]